MHVVSADQPLPTDAAHRRAFLAAFLRRPGTMGAVVPSSTRLSAVLASIVPTAGAPVVVELGPGTGAVSAVIDERLPRGARHLAVELDEAHGRVPRAAPGPGSRSSTATPATSASSSPSAASCTSTRWCAGCPGRCSTSRPSSGCSPRSGTRSARPGRSPPSPTSRAWRCPPRTGSGARCGRVRGGAHHRARVAQHAARVRLRVPASGRGSGPGPVAGGASDPAAG